MVIKVENVSFSYPEREVLRNVSFSVEKGDFVGITGSTGSGKTTLAYTLNGLIPHAVRGRFSGSVEVCGMDTRRHKIPELAGRIGFVFQDPDWQIFSLSVNDEVSFGLRNLGMKDVERRVREALGHVGLTGYGDSMPHKLSHGQKQNLCIASVLAMEPEIIVLDEPTSQLDHRNTLNVYGTLKRLNKEGKTIIVIEHDTDLLYEYATRILMIEKGRIVKAGKSGEVFSDGKLLKRLGIKMPGGCR
jgi:energy-coupling factor transport system ATP-binding protein